MIINHNLPALNTYNKYTIAGATSAKNMEKLSSGYRINRAGDDAAGLSISEKMRAQIKGLNQASRNAQDGISMIQTAEAALGEQHNMLQRMRELTVQAANDTNQVSDREAIQSEIAELTNEVNRIGVTTEFNGMPLLDGSKSEEGFESERLVASPGEAYVAYSSGALWEGDKFTITNGEDTLNNSGVKFSATTGTGFNWDDIDTTSADGNMIKIKKNASTETFEVDIKCKTATAPVESIVVDNEAMALNGDKYVYDNHGVYFEIPQSEFDKIKDGSNVTMNLNDQAVKAQPADTKGSVVGTKSLVNDWAKNGVPSDNTTQMKVEKIVIPEPTDPGKDQRIPDAVKVVVRNEGDLATADGKMIVEFRNAEDKILSSETFTKSTGWNGETFEYKANGAEFNVEIGTNVGTNEALLEVDLSVKIGSERIKIGDSKDTSVAFQVGANARQQISVGFNDMRAESLGITGEGPGFVGLANVTNGVSKGFVEKSLNVTSGDKDIIARVLSRIDIALNKVSEERSKYGAVQNRIEYTISNLNTGAENLQAAESRIRDVDMAKEMMEMTKNNILQQSSQSMLSQSMQRPQSVLQLLQG